MNAEPRFTTGTTVRILDTHAIGHCRTPRYTRGAIGTVESCIGAFRNPEERAYGRTGLPPSRLYWVRIGLSELFADYQGVASDTLLVEVYEHWLKAAERPMSLSNSGALLAPQEPVDEP